MKKKQTPPGRYGKMTRAQLDAESDKFDAEFSTDAAHAATPTELTAHRPANAADRPRRRNRKPRAYC